MKKDTVQNTYGLHPLLLLAGGVVLGAGFFWAGQALFGKNSAASPSMGYQFTNPNLKNIPLKESMTTQERIALQDKLQALVAQRKQDGSISETGIYFRDLNNGPVFGINPDFKFTPASLMKLPLAIAYFAESETGDSGILGQQILFTGPKGTTTEVHYPAPANVVPGTTYSIEQLLDLMLEDSDNDATAILSQYLAADKVTQVYKDLGVEQAKDFTSYTISVRDYAALFRILYNATYLDQPSSEEFLGMLAKSTFSAGIAAGTPAGTTVAHKFGERAINSSAPLYQLHDCGIVYAPGQPYVLCIMTQGSNYDMLASFIKEVSSDVYTVVTAP